MIRARWWCASANAKIASAADAAPLHASSPGDISRAFTVVGEASEQTGAIAGLVVELGGEHGRERGVVFGGVIVLDRLHGVAIPPSKMAAIGLILALQAYLTVGDLAG